MLNEISFRLLSWDDLKAFLFAESLKINRDVDQDVRFLNFPLFCEQTVEGLYLDGALVGFARWDKRNAHLSNIYVIYEARGHGISSKFLQERPIRSLFVMPHNDGAKRLYSRLGFQASQCAVPTREFMIRLIDQPT